MLFCLLILNRGPRCDFREGKNSKGRSKAGSVISALVDYYDDDDCSFQDLHRLSLLHDFSTI